jgi:cell division protein FtsN
VAFLVYIKMLAPKTPGLANGTDAGMAETAPSPGNDAADSKQPSQPPKPRFVFYTELPEMEVVVPEEEIRQHASQPPPAVTERPAATSQPAASPETFYLQAGSFRGADQADRFKAKLALMGFETDIQTITINNRDTYHRVRVGPFSDLGALDRARNRLKQEGIETRTVKIKG